MNRPQSKGANSAAAGFTLVELVIVIVLTGIVAAMTAVFITRPISGYVDLTRRARLVDATESALRRMARDIRIALPNSVRVQAVGSGFALEVLPTLDGGLYFTTPGNPNTGNVACDLNFAGDTAFAIDGLFQGFAIPLTTTAHRLVINNLGTNDVGCPLACNVYTATGSPSAITPVGTTINYTLTAPGTCGLPGSVHAITLSLGHQFQQSGPRQRLFIVTTPVTYLCDRTAQTLTRYWGYTVTADQTTIDTDGELVGAGASRARVTDRVTDCSATTSTLQIQNRGIVTLSLTLSEQGEQVHLIQQVQLDNSR